MIARSGSEQGSQATRPGVLLVVPPFHGLKCPALGVSQLKANLRAAGIEVSGLYLNLRFAERIGPKPMEWLSGTGPFLLGEYLFSHVVHERSREDVERYARDILAGTEMEEMLRVWYPDKGLVESLLYLIGEARAFIENEAVEEILERDPWLVGMSSTFQANCCSLALIQEVKKRRPEVLTMIGGANCETKMGAELLARYPAIDFVGRGECDRTIVDFARALLDGQSGAGIAGFLVRGEEASPASAPLQGPDLDANPYPDYSDYFDMLEQVHYRELVQPGLAMETSRGCWWGIKHHCTFCAFNREGMMFRAKTAENVVKEIRNHIEAYGVTRMEMTDNILDMAYFKSLLPHLAEQPLAEFFWETKANLSRDQVRELASSGVKWIQPGIESLSDRSLQLMKKGSTGMQNVQLLKYCTESGIRISWNWLYGFPGEDTSEVHSLAHVVESIHHLQPPSGSSVLFLERFAPYHENPEEWGLGEVRPSEAYAYVYPLPAEALENIAFFFECEFFSERARSADYQKLRSVCNRWSRMFDLSHFHQVARGDGLVLFDTRSCAKRFKRTLRGLERELYEYLWKARSEKDVLKTFAAEGRERVEGLLKSFVDDHLVLHLSERYLALATDPTAGYREFPEYFPGGQFVYERPEPPSFAKQLADVVSLRTGPREFASSVKQQLCESVIKRNIAAASRGSGGRSTNAATDGA